MPRYLFDLLHGAERIPDEEGRDLPDLEAARRYAIVAAREIVSEQALKGELPLSYALVVRDERGAILLTIPFGDLFTLC